MSILIVFVHYLVLCGCRCVTLHSVGLELQGLLVVSLVHNSDRFQLFNILTVYVCKDLLPIYFFLELVKY